MGHREWRLELGQRLGWLTLPRCAWGEGRGGGGLVDAFLSRVKDLREGDRRAGCSPGPQASRPLPLLLFTATCSVCHARQEARSYR